MARLISKVTKVEPDGGARHELSDGPSKWDIMMAMFVSIEQVPHIQFRVKKSGITFPVGLQCIGREDGSGNQFLCSGILQDGSNRKVEVLFDTRSRTGWIRVAPQGADRSFFYNQQGGKR